MTNEIITGDSMEQLDELDENSVHAIVTDPPYGLAFMGKSWDDFEPKEYQQWCETWARKAQRVLKPGGHMLAFSGNRTHHRLFSGVEDAGYEIRDTITWHYGSGFPKALDVSKSIDKQNDAEREVTGVKPGHEEFAGRDTDGHRQGTSLTGSGDRGREWHKKDDAEMYHMKTAPATDAAEKWDGFKTALKPATEYLVVARKPFDGTVAENIQEHGTGALNIDGTRVEHENGGWTRKGPKDDITGGSFGEQGNDARYMPEGGETSGAENGRYPSNVVFDETQAHALDEEVGETTPNSYNEYDRSGKKDRNTYGDYEDREGGYSAVGEGYKDTGGPSRYFYTSKATKAERTLDGKIENAHPTVKPTDLMEWLVTLVTAENQIVLDPFIGSGTTGMACKNKNRQFIGIERNEEYADIARVRCGLTPDDPSVVREHENQNGLEQYS